MKKMTLAAACLIGMLTFASCNTGANEEQQSTAATGNPVVAPDSTISEDKQELLAFAARNNMLQIELGRLATQQGSTDNVKQYGQKLVDWYTTKQEELQGLAQQYNLTLPQQMEEDQLEHVEEVRNAKGGEFNEKYWESVVSAQKEAVGEFDDNLRDIEETNASAFSIWARNTQKELRAQMEQAMANEQELKNRN
jgi:putative membrane protein